MARTIAEGRQGVKGPQGSLDTACIRIGDACLELSTDHRPLLDELEAVYGDCGIPEPVSGVFLVRCTANLLPGLPLISLAFDAPRVPDLIEAALSPYRTVRDPRYVEAASPAGGWRLLVDTEASDRFLLAARERIALINLEGAPPEFVLDCILTVVQTAQSGVLFLHAGSVGVAGSGALLVAPTRGGKSTTVLALAQRGHAFLGDDLAAVRLTTRELLPFPKSAGLRDGPMARALADRVRECRHMVGPGRHGIVRTLVRVSDLFPKSVNGPLPLRFAFVLDRIAERATISPFRPGFGELTRLKALVIDTTSAWGVSPGRDLLGFLSIVNLLSGLRCYLVERGSPDETARLIERVMEDACT